MSIPRRQIPHEKNGPWDMNGQPAPRGADHRAEMRAAATQGFLVVADARAPELPILPRPRGRLVCEPYLRLVRQQPCCSCETTQGVQAHHHGPRPVGRKTDDYRTVPLCGRCHSHFHATGMILGRLELDRSAAHAFLLSVEIDLLLTYFVGSDIQAQEWERLCFVARADNARLQAEVQQLRDARRSEEVLALGTAPGGL